MISLKDKTILVAGGTGFIGSYLVDHLLKKEANVICLTRQNKTSDNKNLRYIQCDLEKLKSITAKELISDIDIIHYTIYLAASIPVIGAKKEDLISAKENNLDHFLYFINVFGDISKKIIFASSIDIYGMPKAVNFDENTEVKPISNYAIAKYCCENYLEYYSRQSDKPYVILRFSQVYGPNEPIVRVLPIIIDAIVNEKTFTLNGKGEDKRKFLYVQDAVLAICAAINYSENGIFHIAGSEEISIAQSIKIIEEVFKKKLNLKIINQDKQPLHILPSIEYSKNVLNFISSYSFEQGMQEIYSSISEETHEKVR